MGGVSAGSGAGDGVTPTYRVYDHWLLFTADGVGGQFGRRVRLQFC